MGGLLDPNPDTKPPLPPNPHPCSGQNDEEVRTTFGPNLVPKAPEYFF